MLPSRICLNSYSGVPSARPLHVLLHTHGIQLCARQSVMADEAVPRSLGDFFGHAAKVDSPGAQHVLSLLPEGYRPNIVNPWYAAGERPSVR